MKRERQAPGAGIRRQGGACKIFRVGPIMPIIFHHNRPFLAYKKHKYEKHMFEQILAERAYTHNEEHVSLPRRVVSVRGSLDEIKRDRPHFFNPRHIVVVCVF